jgi:hypothetical protein
MRIWDVLPEELCRLHLLGEHRELHAIWAILTEDKDAYRHHPETKRWERKLAALHIRHGQLVDEMARRGYVHRSDLDASLAVGMAVQTELVDPVEVQRRRLTSKPCNCYLPGDRRQE